MSSFDQISEICADETLALKAIDLEVSQGEVVAVLGRDGSGKSALSRFAASHGEPGLGAIRFGGAAVAGSRADIGTIAREPVFFPWLSVSENLGFGLPHRSAFEREGLVANALVRAGLAGHAAYRPDELSIEQQQRLAIARVLVTRPKLLLLDEPFATLDPALRAMLYDLLLALARESRTAILFATREVEEAVALADRIVVAQSGTGRIRYALDNLLPRPRDRRSAAFVAARRELRHALERCSREEVPQQEQPAAAA